MQHIETESKAYTGCVHCVVSVEEVVFGVNFRLSLSSSHIFIRSVEEKLLLLRSRSQLRYH